MSFFYTGAILDEVPKEGEGMKMNGSAAVVVASSKEEIIEILSKDIYATSGVWDLEKVSLIFNACHAGFVLRGW